MSAILRTSRQRIRDAWQPSPRLELLLVFVLVTVVTLLFWVILPADVLRNQSADYTRFYEPVARNIANGRGITLTGGGLATEYPPGFPLILAGVFRLSAMLHVPEDLALSIFALLCFGAAAVFVFLLSRTIWGSHCGLVSAMAWATYPLVLSLTRQPVSELPFLVLFYGGLWALWLTLKRGGRSLVWLFTVGLLMGLSMLVRPIAVAVSLVLAFAMYLQLRGSGFFKKLVPISILLVGTLIAVAPWEAWVLLRTGRVITLSTNGVDSILDGLTFAVRSEEYGTDYRRDFRVSQDALAVMLSIRRHSSEIESLSDVASHLTSHVEGRPLAVAEILALKAIRSWYGTDSGRYEGWILGIQALYLPLLLWGCCRSIRAGGRARDLTVIVLMLLAYCWVMTTLVLSIVRYMVPILGLLFVLLPAAAPRSWRGTESVTVGSGPSS